MIIHLHIKYRTRYGQAFFVKLSGSAKAAKEAKEFKMEYQNEEYWQIAIDTAELGLGDTIKYEYILKEDWQADITDHFPGRSIHLKKIKADSVDIFDEWLDGNLYESVYASRPFSLVLNKVKKVKKEVSKKSSHLFKVFVPNIQEGKAICITGSAKELGQWSEEKAVVLHKSKDGWSIALNLHKEAYPVSFKFGIYDLEQEKLVHFEEGSNRILERQPEKDKLEMCHIFPRFEQFRWKGAGINVPVSALKSEQSWGVGDFTDLNLLVDWAKASGMKLIQLLPINDTISTHTCKDSYPYASISAFALHPMYLNVRRIANAAAVEFSDELQEQVKSLNEKNRLDYEAVVKIKTEAIREVYSKEKHSFKDDFAFFEFFDMNRYWLVPYAAFSYLRDLNNTADASQWEDHSIYNEDEIQELVSPDNSHYDEIAVHYFTQYHLHLQLLDAVEYAHKNGVVLKGDLPIGVGRYGVETWVQPSLFHMDMQAGAPPDAFAVKGQNWEFPTYNWDEMAKDNYAWWRQRMEHMSNYFDAIRIDHILGFFRIWSIPRKDIEGILGTFVPAVSLGTADFENAGIYFNEQRFCDPYITDDILHAAFPGNEQWVKDNMLNNYRFKQTLNTQQQIAAYFKKDPSKAFLQQGLFDLITDVILLRDAAQPGRYHFRISMQQTNAYKQLDHSTQQKLATLYNRYFFNMQDELWQQVGQEKLNALQLNTDMLLCAEDLGMVPDFVEHVLLSREILALQVQRMPKRINESYAHPANAPYLSVVTPSTHDMGTMREWWEEDKKATQQFYNNQLGKYGEAPQYCEPWVCREIIAQHLYAPAMWAVFLLQDLLAADGAIRRENPMEERINVPADPNHNWDYRMHITLEALLAHKPLSDDLATLIRQSGR